MKRPEPPPSPSSPMKILWRKPERYPFRASPRATPYLRKDFIIDEYQLYQARIIGADAILLIAAALKREQCNALAVKAHELELEVLLEIHNEQELEYVNENIDMVGVNNRNLGTFHTDVENSFRLAENYPKKCSGSLKAASPAPKQLNNSELPASEAS